ncbi:MAG TPA: PHP domain-containing protein [Gemmatimonadales bacterium]|nr:PHP domain-containing protein [Gemmatimonadales bacterium]
MHLDLHVHSTCSDGTLAPAAVVGAAQRAGLGMIALADHDTDAGVGPARAAAAGSGVAVLAAIEITCLRDGRELHLLGYGFRPGDPGIAALSARAAGARRERIAALVERLAALGVRMAVADVTTGPECVSVGRLHLARALVRRGHAGSISDAFARFIGDGAPGWVPSRGPDVAAAIGTVVAAGGCPVWAHPALEDARHFPALAERGLAGVEALRPALDPHGSVQLEQAARAAGLVVTGGSDWHGTTRPALGSWFVTEKHVGAFLERLGISPP